MCNMMKFQMACMLVEVTINEGGLYSISVATAPVMLVNNMHILCN